MFELLFHFVSWFHSTFYIYLCPNFILLSMYNCPDSIPLSTYVFKYHSTAYIYLHVLVPFHCSGESIPIRLFLAGYDLSPTMRDINKKFSVRYYLNLVLVDEEERRYFKQQVWSLNTMLPLMYPHSSEAEEQEKKNREGLGTLITWRGCKVDVGGGGAQLQIPAQ